MPRAMSDSFTRCRNWADSSNVLAANIQVYFEHNINGAIPVNPSKARELVALLGENVKAKKDKDANQKIFDREKKKLGEAVAVLEKAKEDHGRAKNVNDRAASDLAAQTKNFASRKLAVAKSNETLVLLKERFIVIKVLVDS